MTEEQAERIVCLIEELSKELRRIAETSYLDDFDNLQQALERCEGYTYKVTLVKED